MSPQELEASAEVTPELGLELRRRLGELWRESALGEHASVAAFARLVLDMMSLGAPPALLKGAARAIDDEIEHARLCFGMARRFTGQAAGPGPLRLDGAIRPSVATGDLVAAAIAEGCVSETVSAAHAELAACRAGDPLAKKILVKIATDEKRHAELSWAFVEWALREWSELKPLAIATFDEALTSVDAAFILEEGNEYPLQEYYGQLLSRSKRQATCDVIAYEILPRRKCMIAGPP